MKKKTLLIILVIVIILVIALAILGLLYITNSRVNTYIYDSNNNEIAEINYADVSFFDTVKSYYLASALENILNDIMEKEHISEDEAEKLLSTGGYKIYLCVDSKEQGKIEKAYKDDTNFSENLESSTIVLDNNTGEVKAIVGGRNIEDKIITFGEYNKNTTDIWAKNVNNATETKLQPGSALTLLSVYACGLESGKITLDSIYSDKPSGDFSNSGITFHGYITVKEAIRLYSNYVALTIAQELGLDTCYNFVKELGINLDEQKDKNIANVSLGGLSQGITLSEIAVANRAILNDGIYKEPMYYTKILDKKNNIYLQKDQKQNQVVKDSVCEDLKSCFVQKINDKTIYVRSANPMGDRVKLCTIVTDKYTYSAVIYNVKYESIDTNKNEAKELLEKLI